MSERLRSHTATNPNSPQARGCARLARARGPRRRRAPRSALIGCGRPLTGRGQQRGDTDPAPEPIPSGRGSEPGSEGNTGGSGLRQVGDFPVPARGGPACGRLPLPGSLGVSRVRAWRADRGGEGPSGHCAVGHCRGLGRGGRASGEHSGAGVPPSHSRADCNTSFPTTSSPSLPSSAHLRCADNSNSTEE